MSRPQLETASSFLVFAVIAGILVAVLLPADSLGGNEGRLRSISERESWVIHAAMFTALSGAVGLRLAAADPSRLSANWLLPAIAMIVAFATVSEFAQVQVDGRNAGVGDWVADLIGTAIGLTIAGTIGPPVLDWLTVDARR